MGENRYPPGYIPLTIHELSANSARGGHRNSRTPAELLGESDDGMRRGGPPRQGQGQRSHNPRHGRRRDNRRDSGGGRNDFSREGLPQETEEGEDYGEE
jgi:hypothetical protein